MNPKYDRQLKKGVLEILVLQLLSKKKMYGYQLIQELRQCSHDFFNLKEGTLYPILYRLEDDGLVVSEWSKPAGREVSKKYYVLSDIGVRNLEELKELWSLFVVEVTKILGDEENE